MVFVKNKIFFFIVSLFLCVSFVVAWSDDVLHIDLNTTVAIDKYYDVFVDYVDNRTQYIWIEKIKVKSQDRLRKNIINGLQKKILTLDGDQKIIFQAVLWKIMQRNSTVQLSTDALISQWVFIDWVNDFREKKNLSQLQYNEKLTQAAYNHATDMYLYFPYDTDQDGVKETISHMGTDGLKVNTRVTNLWYNYAFVAENIGYNQQTVDELIAARVNSPSHYVNLITDKATDIWVAKVGSYRVLVLGTQRTNR